jgi:Ni/Co efflux regulator RcnB
VELSNPRELQMKSKTIVAVLVAMSMAGGGLAFAQGHGNPHDQNRNDQNRNDQARDHGSRNAQGRNQHDDGRQSHDSGNYRNDHRGAGPKHALYKGGRLPSEYRGSPYVVDDWRGYHLSAPPRGYHWVQTGGDYVLVAIASGIILQLLLND